MPGELPSPRERKLERQAHAAIDELEAALESRDPDRAFAAAAIIVLLNRRSQWRDVRVALINAAAALRMPPPLK